MTCAKPILGLTAAVTLVLAIALGAAPAGAASSGDGGQAAEPTPVNVVVGAKATTSGATAAVSAECKKATKKVKRATKKVKRATKKLKKAKKSGNKKKIRKAKKELKRAKKKLKRAKKAKRKACAGIVPPPPDTNPPPPDTNPPPPDTNPPPPDTNRPPEFPDDPDAGMDEGSVGSGDGELVTAGSISAGNADGLVIVFHYGDDEGFLADSHDYYEVAPAVDPDGDSLTYTWEAFHGNYFDNVRSICAGVSTANAAPPGCGEPHTPSHPSDYYDPAPSTAPPGYSPLFAMLINTYPRDGSDCFRGYTIKVTASDGRGGEDVTTAQKLDWNFGPGGGRC